MLLWATIAGSCCWHTSNAAGSRAGECVHIRAGKRVRIRTEMLLRKRSCGELANRSRTGGPWGISPAVAARQCPCKSAAAAGGSDPFRPSVSLIPAAAVLLAALAPVDCRREKQKYLTCGMGERGQGGRRRRQFGCGHEAGSRGCISALLECTCLQRHPHQPTRADFGDQCASTLAQGARDASRGGSMRMLALRSGSTARESWRCTRKARSV